MVITYSEEDGLTIYNLNKIGVVQNKDFSRELLETCNKLARHSFLSLLQQVLQFFLTYSQLFAKIVKHVTFSVRFTKND